MKLIVGLGNPGPEYARTRHNIGFVLADRLAAHHAPGGVVRARFHAMVAEARLPGASANDPDVRALILKPTTYMNRSGQSVGEALRFYKLDPEEDLLVLVDDTALPCGSFRLRASGGAGGHNGLKDIERALGTQKYARVRIGVDDKGDRVLSDYVLSKFAPDQWEKVEPVLPRMEEACLAWAHEGIDHAMNTFNAKEKKPKPPKAPPPEDTGDTEPAQATDAA